MEIGTWVQGLSGQVGVGQAKRWECGKIILSKGHEQRNKNKKKHCVKGMPSGIVKKVRGK